MNSTARVCRGVAAVSMVLALLLPLSVAATPAEGDLRTARTAIAPATEDLFALLGAADALAPPKSPSNKLSSDLALLLDESGLSQADAGARAANLRLDGNRVQVSVTPDEGKGDLAVEALLGMGAQVTSRSQIDGRIQAWIPVAALQSAVAEPSLAYLSTPGYALALEDLDGLPDSSQGVVESNATVWHAAGHQGTGVSVAIVDIGFGGYLDLLGSHLPAAVIARNFCDGETVADMNTGTAQGTACAEIVHDMAPLAGLYLIKIATDLDLEEAVTFLRSEGVDVISCSVGWACQVPGDGTGFFADLATVARDDGILWATAAGNEREHHWIGEWSMGAWSQWLDFGGGRKYNFFLADQEHAALIPAGQTLTLAMRWDDWDETVVDLDLGLYRFDGQEWVLVAHSANVQDGGPVQQPTERLTYTTSGDAAPYGYAVYCGSGFPEGTAVEIHAPGVPYPIHQNVPEWSILDLGDAPSLMTVAAVNVVAPYLQEPYSSQGPLKGPGGAMAIGLPKPEIAAYARVDTMAYDDPVGGTSSATAHVAGAAALVFGAHWGKTPQQVESYLVERALDLGTAGTDYLYGAGRLWLGDLPTTPTITSTPSRSPTWTPTISPTITPTWTPSTPTMSPTWTPTISPTITPTWTPSTPTISPTPCRDVRLPLVMRMLPPTPTPTYTPSPTPTPRPTSTPAPVPTWDPNSGLPEWYQHPYT